MAGSVTQLSSTHPLCLRLFFALCCIVIDKVWLIHVCSNCRLSQCCRWTIASNRYSAFTFRYSLCKWMVGESIRIQLTHVRPWVKYGFRRYYSSPERASRLAVGMLHSRLSCMKYSSPCKSVLTTSWALPPVDIRGRGATVAFPRHWKFRLLYQRKIKLSYLLATIVATYQNVYLSPRLG